MQCLCYDSVLVSRCGVCLLKLLCDVCLKQFLSIGWQLGCVQVVMILCVCCFGDRLCRLVSFCLVMMIVMLCLVWLMWFVIGMICEIVLFFVVFVDMKYDRQLLCVKLFELLMLFWIFVFIMCVEFMLLQMLVLIILFIVMQLRWCMSFGWLLIFCGCSMIFLWNVVILLVKCCMVVGFSDSVVVDVKFSVLLLSRLSMLFWIILVQVVRFEKLVELSFVSIVFVMLLMFDCSGSRFFGRWLCFIL